MRTLLLTLPLAVGCGFHPDEGTWLYLDEVETENTCGFDYASTQGSFVLQDNGDGNLVIDPLDGSDPFACLLETKGWNCPQRFVEDVDIGLGAIVEVRASTQGEFSSRRAGSGSQTAVFSCKNATCDAAANLAGVPDPCTISVAFDTVWYGADTAR